MRKTTIISIAPCMASPILTSLHESHLPCNYIGLEQKGRILMEITHQEEHEEYLGDINRYMEKNEQFIKELAQVFNEVIEKLDEEIKKKRYKRTKTETAA